MPPKILAISILGLLSLLSVAAWALKKPAKKTASVPVDRLKEIRQRVTPTLTAELRKLQLEIGNPPFIRIFKETKEAEVWLEPASAEPGRPWVLFKTYPVQTYGNGTLGPKLKEGDGQAPEGFYSIAPAQLNPQSKYHLAFNIGYPNAYDTAKERTGSFIMMHGKAVSIGCFAMGDPAIEEIYLLAEAALQKPDSQFSVHIFPFRLTPERLAKEEKSPWFGFWKDTLLPVFKTFEATKQPPVVKVEGKDYILEPPSPP